MYTQGIPPERLILLDMAERMGLFEDFRCGSCDKPNKVDWRNEKIKANTGIHFTCSHCGVPDIIGWDNVEDAANDLDN